MDFSGGSHFYCLNQDIQDLRIFRIVVYGFFRGIIFLLSESGYPKILNTKAHPVNLKIL
jgi:hypothetical protein